MFTFWSEAQIWIGLTRSIIECLSSRLSYDPQVHQIFPRLVRANTIPWRIRPEIAGNHKSNQFECTQITGMDCVAGNVADIATTQFTNTASWRIRKSQARVAVTSRSISTDIECTIVPCSFSLVSFRKRCSACPS